MWATGLRERRAHGRVHERLAGDELNFEPGGDPKRLQLLLGRQCPRHGHAPVVTQRRLLLAFHVAVLRRERCDERGEDQGSRGAHVSRA